MTADQIRELADKYKELEQKDPFAFAELKMEIGEWGEGKFEWKRETFKGKVQYSSIFRGEKGMTKKFVIKEEDLPKDFKLEEGSVTNFYSIVEFFEMPEKKFSVFYIKLRKPYNTAVKEKQKEETIYSGK